MRFNPLIVPKQLQAALPFKSTPYISLDLPRSPYISLYLPVSPTQAALPFKSTPKDDAPAAKGKGRTAKQVPGDLGRYREI